MNKYEFLNELREDKNFRDEVKKLLGEYTMDNTNDLHQEINNLSKKVDNLRNCDSYNKVTKLEEGLLLDWKILLAKIEDRQGTDSSIYNVVSKMSDDIEEAAKKARKRASSF